MFQNCSCLNYLIYWNQIIFGKSLPVSVAASQTPPTPSYRAAQDIDWDILTLDL